MEIQINDRKFAFEVNGTVGLVYLAQRILGDEEFDGKDPYHQVVLYYSALATSNKNDKNLPDLQTFLACMTTRMMNEISTYFWERWNELEGGATESTDGKQGEG